MLHSGLRPIEKRPEIRFIEFWANYLFLIADVKIAVFPEIMKFSGFDLCNFIVRLIIFKIEKFLAFF